MLNAFLYIATTIVVTLYIQSNKVFEYVFVGKYLKELRECPKCLGFWVALAFYPIFQQGVLQGYYSNDLAVITDPFLTALYVSVMSNYLIAGFRTQHIPTIIK